jgi:hypothetical protein
MKKNRIKTLNEYFSQTLTGDSFNSSDGVFKVNYKPYNDLSISVGRDPDPSLLIKDSVFQIGDIVKGNVHGKKKKIKGEVIEVTKAADGKSYKIKVQDLANKRTHALIPGSVEFIEDRGNTKNVSGLTITSRERMAQNIKYTGGNVIWGSLESVSTQGIPVEQEEIFGPMQTGWKIKLQDSPIQTPNLLGSLLVDPDSTTINCYSKEDSLIDKIKAGESFCFLLHHNELKTLEDSLKLLMSILFLEMRKEEGAKKILVQNFHHITGKSYGETKDAESTEAKRLIQNFLNDGDRK